MEVVKKKQARRKGLNHRQYQDITSPAAQRRDRVSTEIKSRTKAIKHKALHPQNYLVCHRALLVANMQRLEIHRWEQFNPLKKFQASPPILHYHLMQKVSDYHANNAKNIA